ncbi:MAG: hypothetical protein HY744_04240 [Deltaproteobacteria bacterium]|nr:hypothetical protein [Deltaproteobacteria bacterium]
MPLMTTTHPYRCAACGRYYPARVDVCAACWRPGLVLLWPARHAAEVDAVAEVTTAAALCRAAWDETRVGAYPDLRIGRDTLLVATGGPGAGKTTWACRALDSVAGPVTMWAAETGPGPALAALLARLVVRRESFHVVGRADLDAVHRQLARSHAVALAVDSVQVAETEPDDLRHLLAVLPDLRLAVAVSQLNKAGVIEGAMRLAHEADVIVELHEMSWTLAKSRYQPIAGVGGPVLAAPAPAAATEECHVATA